MKKVFIPVVPKEYYKTKEYIISEIHCALESLINDIPDSITKPRLASKSEIGKLLTDAMCQDYVNKDLNITLTDDDDFGIDESLKLNMLFLKKLKLISNKVYQFAIEG